jgi:AcrR family transcriptional regulator
VNSADESGRRPYRAGVRAEQAAATRTRVAASAADLFAREGYSVTTVADVARAAGVSGQTVYNAFGTKAALLKAAYDLTLAGDDQDVPLAERPEVRALYAQTDAAAFLRGYADLGRSLLERLAPLLLQVHGGAAAGDPDLVALVGTTDAERLVGTGMVARRVDDLGALRPGLTVEQARDRIWTLNSVEVWHLCVDRRGWTPREYADWVGEQMCAAVLA